VDIGRKPPPAATEPIGVRARIRGGAWPSSGAVREARGRRHGPEIPVRAPTIALQRLLRALAGQCTIPSTGQGKSIAALWAALRVALCRASVPAAERGRAGERSRDAKGGCSAKAARPRVAATRAALCFERRRKRGDDRGGNERSCSQEYNAWARRRRSRDQTQDDRPQPFTRRSQRPALSSVEPVRPCRLSNFKQVAVALALPH
jgi:hypothetical protein